MEEVKRSFKAWIPSIIIGVFSLILHFAPSSLNPVLKLKTGNVI